MEFNYEEMISQITIRMKQIEDIALEDDFYNAEYMMLAKTKGEFLNFLKVKKTKRIKND